MFTKHFKFYYYFRKENLILMLLHEFVEKCRFYKNPIK